MNIATLLRRTAGDRPDKVAVRLDDAELTYGEFRRRAAGFAAFLLSDDVTAGQRIACYLPNRIDYLVAALGVWQAGGVVVPLNYMFPPGALSHAVRDSGATHLIVLPEDADRVRELLGDDCPVVLALGAGGDFEAACEAHPPLERVVARLDGDDALIMYTSGSTGVPKGVRQTHRNCAAQCEAAIDRYEIVPDDVALACMPLFHVGGMQLSALVTLLRGAELTMMARWNVERWFELARTLRPTYGGLVATMMIDAANHGMRHPERLDSFRICMFGGSRTPSAVIERLREGTGIVGTEIYGQTEQSGLVITYGVGEERRDGSMGRELDQIVQLRLVPVDGSAELEPGDDGVGEMWVHGDAVTPGYWQLEPAEKWSDDGWLRTGDLVSRDADGYLYYVDRIDDMIISGGENVFPQMVEEHLAACPDLAQVAVIGTAHERWVHQVTAVVVPARDGVTVEEIDAWCRTNPELRGMHRPRRIEIVSELPRTGTGKLDRPALRELFP